MEITSFLKITAFSLLIISTKVVSNVIIKSPLKTELIFSEGIKGENVEPYSWGKLLFKGNGSVIDMGIKNRYFTEQGASKLSPTGRYFIVKSISGGILNFGGKKTEYVDRLYCSVVDMKNGCYVSDWDGEACGYDWNKNEDVLEDSTGSQSFDFLSLRPTINNVKNDLSILKKNIVRDYLRCDAPDEENINTYQEAARVNKGSKLLIEEYIVRYLNGIAMRGTVREKTFLFSIPGEKNITPAYLVIGDEVKIIKVSADHNWINVGYINSKGMPLIAWIKSDSLEK